MELLPELPSSRDLIGLRAACARVANMSGAAEQIDQIYRDKEDTAVIMACDGSPSFVTPQRTCHCSKLIKNRQSLNNICIIRYVKHEVYLLQQLLHFSRVSVARPRGVQEKIN
jgi:hypothetical protein